MKFSHKFWAGAIALSVLGTLCFHPITAEARSMTAAEQAATGNIGSHADAGTYTRLAIVLVVVAAAVTVSVAIRNKLVAKQQKKMEEVRRQASGQAGPAPREDIFEGYGDGEDDDKKNDDVKKDPRDEDISEM